ncbi:BUD14 [Candida pseudojiufengensis]|uniref:BUD14 n=1 Tax=Candida pseudojiufengensis TaxID=497109 RepID=UPI002224206E|nr:BUD14 [Candida pseudojiufengensis]KAI5963277.1 BUD14 [Candida pseudojiufengensis]
MDLPKPNNRRLDKDKVTNNNNNERDNNNMHTSIDQADRILQELDRKLSGSSTSSSQQTQTSSVIHNHQFNGLGKHNIQSNILNKSSQLQQQLESKNDDQILNSKDEMIYNHIFNPTEIFNEVSMKNFKTTFNNQYNDDKLALNGDQNSTKSNLNKSSTSNGSKAIDNSTDNNGKLVRKNSLNLTQHRLEKSSQEESNKKSSSIQDENIPHRLEILEGLQNYNSDDDIEEDQFDKEENTLESNAANSQYDQFSMEDEDEEEGEEDDEDLMMTLSPPRSPPSELDPEKLYGLYDFSGPDPSHCSLSRDEPVHLVNDEDNYWWLIKKLTKIERIERTKSSDENLMKFKNIDELSSDEEDGKIGFVPAECLETHGERLARLNCFKNEEIEKNYSTDENNLTFKKKSSVKSSKSVTFVNLKEMEENESEKDDHSKQINGDDQDVDEVEDNEKDEDKDEDSIRIKIDNIYSTMDDQEIRENLDQFNIESPDLKISKSNEQETLSDVYPLETPLIINKKSLNKSPVQPTTNSTTSTKMTTPILQQTNKFNESLYQKPNKFSNYDAFDEVSIGSFSPDTPLELKSPKFRDINDVNRSPNLRRSIILDRLTKVTSDIEEQMNQKSDDDEEEVTQSTGSDEQLDQNENIQKLKDIDSDDDEEFSFDSYAQDHSIEIARNCNNEPSYEIGEKNFSPENLPYKPESGSSIEEIDAERFIENTKSNDESKSHTRQDAQNSTINLINNSMNLSTSSLTSNLSKLESNNPFRSNKKSNSSTPQQQQIYRTSTSSINYISSAEKLRSPSSIITQQQQKDTTYVPSSSLSPAGANNYYNKNIPKSSTSIIDEEVEILSDIDNDYSNQNFEENNITPLTSMNSLTPQQNTNNSNNTLLKSSNKENSSSIHVSSSVLLDKIIEKEKITPIKEKRKSRAVNDMFMPILGKFDELAEKLAELDDYLR